MCVWSNRIHLSAILYKILSNHYSFTSWCRHHPPVTITMSISNKKLKTYTHYSTNFNLYLSPRPNLWMNDRAATTGFPLKYAFIVVKDIRCFHLLTSSSFSSKNTLWSIWDTSLPSLTYPVVLMWSMTWELNKWAMKILHVPYPKRLVLGEPRSTLTQSHLFVPVDKILAVIVNYQKWSVIFSLELLIWEGLNLESLQTNSASRRTNLWMKPAHKAIDLRGRDVPLLMINLYLALIFCSFKLDKGFFFLRQIESGLLLSTEIFVKNIVLFFTDYC